MLVPGKCTRSSHMTAGITSLRFNGAAFVESGLKTIWGLGSLAV